MKCINFSLNVGAKGATLVQTDLHLIEVKVILIHNIS